MQCNLPYVCQTARRLRCIDRSLRAIIRVNHTAKLMQQRPNFLQMAIQGSPVVTTTIAINIVVFLAWQFVDGDIVLFHFMISNFLTSWDGLLTGHVWTLLTSAYSHVQLLHLAINMFVLWNFGVLIERQMGRQRFLLFYVVCSVVGSLAHCITSAWLLGMPDRGALGASGAVCGVLMAFALEYPKARILLFGIVPVPALICVIGMAGFDVLGVINQSQGQGFGIGHAAHLGGGIAGGLLWLGMMRQQYRR